MKQWIQIIILGHVVLLSACNVGETGKTESTEVGTDTSKDTSIDSQEPDSAPAFCTAGTMQTSSCAGEIANALVANRTETCAEDGSAFIAGACQVTSCASGYDLSNNSCEATATPASSNVLKDAFLTTTITIPSGIPSKQACTAPCAVLFDASGTTAVDEPKPFHHLLYEWDFGDDLGETWPYSNEPRNTAQGPMASHLFKNPGTYTVTLNVYAQDGGYSAQQMVIDVADPDVFWSGTKTTCFSNNTDFTGCPTGAGQATETDFNNALATYCAIATQARCLFKAGDIFLGSYRHHITGTDILIGSFGGGKAQIKLASGNSGITYLRPQGLRISVANLDFEGGYDNGSQVVDSWPGNTDFLLYNISIVPKSFHVVFTAVAQGNAPNSGLFIIDSDLPQIGYSNGGQHIFMNQTNFAIMGNNFDDVSNGEHQVRVAHGEKGVISHNFFRKQAPLKSMLTIRSDHQTDDSGNVCTLNDMACLKPTKQLVVSGNYFQSAGAGTLNFTSGNSGSQNPAGRDIIAERNFIERDPSVSQAVYAGIQLNNTKDGTIRNNIIYMENWADHTGIQVIGYGLLVGGVEVYNNSCFGTHEEWAIRCVDWQGDLSDGKFMNNLLYLGQGHSSSGAVTNKHGGTAPSIASSNLMTTTNPFIVDVATKTDAVVPADFKPNSDGQLIGQGRTVHAQGYLGLYYDFENNFRDFPGSDAAGTPSIGAYE